MIPHSWSVAIVDLVDQIPDLASNQSGSPRIIPSHCCTGNSTTSRTLRFKYVPDHEHTCTPGKFHQQKTRLNAGLRALQQMAIHAG